VGWAWAASFRCEQQQQQQQAKQLFLAYTNGVSKLALFFKKKIYFQLI